MSPNHQEINSSNSSTAEPAIDNNNIDEPLLFMSTPSHDTTGGDIVVVTEDNNDDDNNNNDNNHEFEGMDGIPRGTIASARFNILSTMVRGGCLSLPLTFQQSGNALVGPLVLIVIAFISNFCFRLLVASANYRNPPHHYRPGKDSFESITSEVFGPIMYVFSTGDILVNENTPVNFTGFLSILYRSAV
jgi:hypothetical protein